MSQRIRATVSVNLVVNDEAQDFDTEESLARQDSLTQAWISSQLKQFFEVGEFDKFEVNVKHELVAGDR